MLWQRPAPGRQRLIVRPDRPGHHCGIAPEGPRLRRLRPAVGRYCHPGVQSRRRGHSRERRHRMTLELQPTPQEVMRAVEALQDFARTQRAPEKTVFGLALALEECGSNIVNHALRSSK